MSDCDRKGCPNTGSIVVLTEAPNVMDHDITTWHLCETHAPVAVGEFHDVGINILSGRPADA